jgi:ribose-phosphate pyrophosphokinase
MGKKFIVFCSRSGQYLGRDIIKALGTKCDSEFIGKINITNFADNEIQLTLEDSVRGQEAILIAPTECSESIVEALITSDAIKGSSAEKLTVIIPYFGYARQDRKTRGRESIAAQLFARLFKEAGADRVVTVDLHAGQIQGFFVGIRSDDLKTVNLFVDQIKKDYPNLENLVIMSPDAGGFKNAQKLSDLLHGGSFGVVFKERDYSINDHVSNFKILGDVKGKDILFLDDLSATFSTVAGGILEVKKAGARTVAAALTHWVCDKKVTDQVIKDRLLNRLYITNSHPHSEYPISLGYATKIDIAPLIANVILEIVNDGSISKLLKRK